MITPPPQWTAASRSRLLAMVFGNRANDRNLQISENAVAVSPSSCDFNNH